MKRPRAGTGVDVNTPITRNEQVKVGRSFVPKNLKDDKQLWEYLMYISDVCQNLTQPISYSFGSGKAKWVQSVSAINQDYYPQGNRSSPRKTWTPSSSRNLSHFPLIAIGETNANLSFCRVSTQAGDYGTLYVSFRPFLLQGIPEMVFGSGDKGKLGQAASFFSALGAFMGRDKVTTANLDSEGMVMTNLLYLMNVVSNPNIDVHSTPDGDVEIGHGYNELLTGMPTKVVLENDFENLAEDDERFGTAKERFLQHQRFLQHRLRHVGNKAEVQSVIDTLVAFIQAWTPTNVIFTGFSLGGGSSTAAACLCHMALAKQGGPVPKLHIASLAGTMVGGPGLRAYVQRHFESCITLKLKGSPDGEVLEDPVSQMPFSSKFVHVGQVLIADYDNKTLSRSTTNRNAQGVNTGGNPSWALMLSQIPEIPLVTSTIRFTKLTSADRLLANAFSKIHLTGEDMIPRICALEMLRHGMKSPLLNGVSCAWFTGTGTAAKYKTCFEETGLCSLEDVESAVAKRVRGQYAGRYKPRVDCVRTNKIVTSNNTAPRRILKARR